MIYGVLRYWRVVQGSRAFGLIGFDNLELCIPKTVL